MIRNLSHANSIMGWLADLIAVAAFLISVGVPLAMTLSTEYAAPTAFYALQITRSGSLGIPSLVSQYWLSNVRVEAQFPIAAILLSVYMQVTNLPVGMAMFVPLSGLAFIVYLAIARHILSADGIGNGYGKLLASVYYAFLAVTWVYTAYDGRATLGVIILAYFLLAYLHLLENYSRAGNVFPWMTIAILLAASAAAEYYFAALAIFMALLTLLVLPAIAPSLWRLRGQGQVALLLVLIFLVQGPFTYILTQVGGSLSPVTFVNNIVAYFAVLLRIDLGSGVNVYSGTIPITLFQRITYVWIAYGLRLLAIVATIWVMIRYRPTKSAPKVKVAWLFSPVVIFVSLSELGYLFVGPVPPLRFIGIFGLVFAFVVAQGMLAYRPIDEMKDRHNPVEFRKVLTACLLILVALGAVGSFSYTLSKSIAKPYAVQTVEPVSGFLMSHSTSSNALTISGDADYIANVFYITAMNNRLESVNPVPLEEGSYRLASAVHSGETSSFTAYMKQHNIAWLLFVNDGRPIWGDEWGYYTMVTNVGSLNMSLVYDDGLAQVYGTA